MEYFFCLLCSALVCVIYSFSAHSSNGVLATTSATCAPYELAALRALAASFPAGDFLDWEASNDCCTWGASLTCATSSPTNKSSGNQWRVVTGLSLDVYTRGMLNYPIPFSLCNLSSLTSLRLSGNYQHGGLSGSIPHCIGTHLTNLVLLDLSTNSLTGTIPRSFSHLQSLQLLDLSYNSLSGQVGLFPSVGPLPNLTSLFLSLNSFSGPIPSFNTPLLQVLDLSYNSFSGFTHNLLEPHKSSTLASLSYLDLSYNSLSGEIPNFGPSLFPSLAYLILGHNLLSENLQDSICGPSSLCRKPNFTYLDASYNQFVGPFPDWIGSLQNLQTLDLSYNNLSGSLPKSWKNLSLLESLGISGNLLAAPNPGTAKLPSWFFTLPSLTSVFISSLGLQLTDLHCSSLLLLLKRSNQVYILDLSMNNISSDVLLCLSSNYSTYSLSSQGSSLYLSGNPLALDLNLKEAIQLLPQQFSLLDMSSCWLRGRLSGSFFDRIGASVTSLNLAHNRLGGQVPPQLGNLSQLNHLDLSDNYFTGVAPLKKKLLAVDILLSNNSLGGKLSSLLVNFLNFSACHQIEGTPIDNLDVSYNYLTGLIPPWLGQCFPNAGRLKLNDNSLEGLIPNELFQNSTVYRLQILSMSNNQLTGQIPSSLRNLNELELLDLSHNRLNGNLETNILFSNASSNQYTYLRVLLLGYNNFTGYVPPSLDVIAPALQLIDFSNNHLTGMIPVHILQNFSAFRIISNRPSFSAPGTLYEEVKINNKGKSQLYPYVVQALTLLDLSGNNLSGLISTGLGELYGLVALNLSRNRFLGPIPSDLGKLVRQLEVLDLSFNELVGPIPASFQNLTSLEVFNVSYNPGLSGPIPQNPQLENANCYIGDPNLCGDAILRSCNVVHVTPSTHFDMSIMGGKSNDMSILGGKSNGFADWIDEWIAIPGLCLGIVVGFLGTLYALAIMYPR